MVEVLVAIVILSIGVLGAMGMQVNAIRMNKEVRFQATALTMARELAEKMRGNHAVAAADTTAANPYLLSTTLTPSTAPTAPTSCYANQCSVPLDIAKWDIYDWQLRVRDALPSPRIVICKDKDPFDASGNPKWACDATGGVGDVTFLKLAWNRASTTGQSQFTADATTTLPMIVLPLTPGSHD